MTTAEIELPPKLIPVFSVRVAWGGREYPKKKPPEFIGVLIGGSGGDLLSVGIDYMAFDCGVNSVPAQAIKSLQRVVGVAIDGIVGVKTVAAINAYKGDLISAYAAERLCFMKTLKRWRTFGRGWQKRVENVQAQAASMKRSSKLITESIYAPAKANPKDQSITETLKKPEAWASAGGLLSGLGGMASGAGPIQWALAIIMVGAFASGAYFLIKRMQ